MAANQYCPIHGRAFKPNECAYCKKLIKKVGFAEKIKIIIVHAQKSLKEDLEEFAIVGGGFWESIEKKILAVYDEVVTENEQKLQQFIKRFREELIRQEIMDTFSERNVNLAFDRCVEVLLEELEK